MKFIIGNDLSDRAKRKIDSKLLATHMHLVGATGTGKSVALLRTMQQLLLSPERCGLFLIDPMGNLSRDLLNFIAHPLFCTDDIRDRLVYVEPARDNWTAPLNPIASTSDSNRYYQVTRAMDIVLRAWDAQNLGQQPRLAQWMFNAMYSAALLNLPIATCRYLLQPKTPEHEAIMAQLPPEVRADWHNAMRNPNEADRILESTRNRMRPFFVSPNLKRMFGAQISRFDCRQFLRDRRIVILNLGSYGLGEAGALSSRDGDAIGGLVLNEVMEAAHAVSLSEGRHKTPPTYVVMDEFQNFVSPDIERALPTVRQLNLRLILAHQSFSQLEKSEVDLSQMIWQARTRMVFANSAADADIVADELAKLTFDDKVVKDLRMTTKQRIAGQRIIWLESQNNSQSQAEALSSSDGTSISDSTSSSENPEAFDVHNAGQSRGSQRGMTSTNVVGYSNGRHQAMQPIYEDVEEIASKTFQTFEEWSLKWAREIRRASVGQAYITSPDRPEPQLIKVKYFPMPDDSAAADRRAELLERNFASDIFISASEADREMEAHRVALLTHRISVNRKPDDKPNAQVADESESTESESPFPL